MYSSLIFSGTVDRQILPTMHHVSEFPISLIDKASELQLTLSMRVGLSFRQMTA